MARGWIAADSSLELVLLRSALPSLDPKRASKWAAAIEVADHAGVSKRRFGAFLKKRGGIEGRPGEWRGAGLGRVNEAESEKH